jgi:uncharacterized protein YdeI (YjbR/CyaY-like superfamily)
MPTKEELPIVEFEDQAAWERWLEANHQASAGVRLRFAKKGSGAATVTHAQALETALCYGWIDGQAGRFDDRYWLVRFTPRGPRSRWSQINRENAERLIAEGRMKPSGLGKVKEAHEDGRWEEAYPAQSRATVPDDLQRALDRNPEAEAFFATLKSAERYAFLYRLHHTGDRGRRAKRIADYIALLNERKTL